MEITPEQRKDIEERVAKAATILKELQLVPAVQTSSVNLGGIDPKFNGIFGTYLQCFLQDTKYAEMPKNSVESPIQADDLK